MRILLDECVDWRLSRDLPGHEVATARRMGWTTVANGELLALASGRFDVFITGDRKLASQQSVGSFNLAVVVLRAKTNRLADIRPLVPELVATLPLLKPGTATEIGV